VDSPFSLEFIQAVELEVTANDMLLILRLTDETPEKDEQTAVELIGKGVVNMIIWPSARAFPSQIFGRLRVLGANMVFFDRMLPGPYADYVGLDNDDAMAGLFSCASPRDLANPVFVTHSDLIADSDRMREDAFMKQCRKRGLKGQVVALPFKAGIAKLPESLFKASAVFCVNDEMAARLQPQLKGRPLFGIDGLSDRFISYRQPMAEMAKAAVAALLEQQRKGPKWKTSRRFFKGELINV
jgi:DNA-binding LacI/PurR family transcriptional regulator